MSGSTLWITRPSHASLVYPWETLDEPLVPLISVTPEVRPILAIYLPSFRGLFRGLSLFQKKKKLIERRERERGAKGQIHEGWEGIRTSGVAKMRRMRGSSGEQ